MAVLERRAGAVAAWAKTDGARALHPADHAAIPATEAVRSLILDLFEMGHDRDLFNACARLGSLMAEAGASPSLVAGTIDGALAAQDDGGSSSSTTHDPSRLASARASLLEGYVATRLAAEHAESTLRWEYPACAVRLDASATAVACGLPTDDREELAAWAARVATRLAKDGTRRVVLSGSDLAKTELASALELLGVEVRSGASPPAATPGRATSWLRLPWRR